jgi:hypothetical protein
MKPDDIITITADTIDLDSFTIDYDALKGSCNGISITDFGDSAPKGIKLKEGEDITIGDRSLLKTLDAIAERLAILETNTNLEAEFEELHRLGNQYRKMEAELKDKIATWNILKK